MIAACSETVVKEEVLDEFGDEVEMKPSTSTAIVAGGTPIVISGWTGLPYMPARASSSTLAKKYGASDDIQLPPGTRVPFMPDCWPYRLQLSGCPICGVRFPSTTNYTAACAAAYGKIHEISASVLYLHLGSTHKDMEGSFFSCSNCLPVKSRSYKTIDSHLNRARCGGSIEFEYDPSFPSKSHTRKGLCHLRPPTADENSKTADTSESDLLNGNALALPGVDGCPFCDKPLGHGQRVTAYTIYNHIHSEHPDHQGDMFRCSACPSFSARSHTAVDRHYKPNGRTRCSGSLIFDPELLRNWVKRRKSIIKFMDSDSGAGSASEIVKETNVVFAPDFDPLTLPGVDECPFCDKPLGHGPRVTAYTVYNHIHSEHPDIQGDMFRCSACPRFSARSHTAVDRHYKHNGRTRCSGSLIFDPELLRDWVKKQNATIKFMDSDSGAGSASELVKNKSIVFAPDFDPLTLPDLDECPFCEKKFWLTIGRGRSTVYTIYRHIHSEHSELQGNMFRCSECTQFLARSNSAVERHFKIVGGRRRCGGTLIFDPEPLLAWADKEKAIVESFQIDSMEGEESLPGAAEEHDNECHTKETSKEKPAVTNEYESHERGSMALPGVDECPFCKKQFKLNNVCGSRVTAYTVYNHIHADHTEFAGNMFRCSTCPKFSARSHTAVDRHYKPNGRTRCTGSLIFDPDLLLDHANKDKDPIESVSTQSEKAADSVLDAKTRKKKNRGESVNQQDPVEDCDSIENDESADSPSRDKSVDDGEGDSESTSNKKRGMKAGHTRPFKAAEYTLIGVRSCSLCDLPFRLTEASEGVSANSMLYHLRAVHPEWDGDFLMCTACDATSRWPTVMSNHYKKGCTGHMVLNTEAFKDARACDEIFGSITAEPPHKKSKRGGFVLEEHTAEVSTTDSLTEDACTKPYPACILAHSSDRSKQDGLVSHLLLCHPEWPKFACTQCAVTANDHAEMQQHFEAGCTGKKQLNLAKGTGQTIKNILGSPY